MEEQNKASAGQSVKRRVVKKTGVAKVRTMRRRHMYYTGVQAQRRIRYIQKRTAVVMLAVWQVICSAFTGLVGVVKRIGVNNGLFTGRGMEALSETATRIKSDPVKSSLKLAGGMFTSLLKAIFKMITSPNYIMPAVAASLFVFTIMTASDMTFALQVYYDGEVLGYIEDETVFSEAERTLQDKIVFDDVSEEATQAVPTFSLAVVQDNSEMVDAEQLSNDMARASGTMLEEAVGLYIGEEFLGAVTDGEAVTELLDNMLMEYSTGDPTEVVEFTKEVELIGGLYPMSSLVSTDYVENEVSKEAEAEVIYTTVKGDAPILIAQKNDMPYSDLKALNPTIETKLLVGQEVLVSKSVPYLGVRIVKEETYEEEIAFETEYQQDTSQYVGYSSVKSDGTPGVRTVTASVVYEDGVEVSREVITSEVTTEPIDRIMVIGGKDPIQQMPNGTFSSGFIWPTNGGYVSCGINGYWGHTGMDIALPMGTPIKAAASGTVTKVTYSSYGYGYHVMINHGGGMETLYAHNSRLNVQVGQWVDQGAIIAYSGNTGNSSGPHVHFEIRQNGRYLDPASFVGTTPW